MSLDKQLRVWSDLSPRRGATFQVKQSLSIGRKGMLENTLGFRQ